jgi:hypothetical protein
MIRLELNPEEQHILAEALESYITDLRMEIGGTESKDFRDMLKNQEGVLRKILEELAPGRL